MTLSLDQTEQIAVSSKLMCSFVNVLFVDSFYLEIISYSFLQVVRNPVFTMLSVFEKGGTHAWLFTMVFRTSCPM